MRGDHQMKIRMPVEMKDWLEREAARNLRSLTAEIVVSIRERMERTKKTAPEGVAPPTEA
jgi:hypothetical protein